jgi:hypothetical protein
VPIWGSGSKSPPNKDLQRHEIYAEIPAMKRKVKEKGSVQPDATVSYLSSVVLFVPFTQKALAWLRKNCSTEDWQWENDNLSVERSTAEAIIQGMKSAGFVVANDP